MGGSRVKNGARVSEERREIERERGPWVKR
jgi:hypothetical protein